MQWAASFDVCCCLDSNGFNDQYSAFDFLIAAGVKAEAVAQAGDAFEALADFRKIHNGWITGFFGYDLKNETEALTSDNEDHLEFPDLYFFEPKHLIKIKGDTVSIESPAAEQIFAAIEQSTLHAPSIPAPLDIKSRFSKQDYIASVNRIKEHITRGDIYVTNFCQEFYAEDVSIDALGTYNRLNEISPNPFASFFKYHHQYILCASPERFLAKRGDKLISQPIKGTARREHDQEKDAQIKQQLRDSIKEQQENVMIVDLVRNDLTKSAVAGTVKVDELFGLYTFRQVHQMISTVSCILNLEVSPVEAIKNTFPMGSMTGAPKVSAMQLMENFERSKRGVYSGAIGYFDDKDHFDFNVVIRSIIYNAQNKYLSFQAGSAITFDADAGLEYEECLLKLKAILQVLNASIIPE
nr:anthranilate synthase component I family protein [Mucilaginibacter straminoryzae]